MWYTSVSFLLLHLKYHSCSDIVSLRLLFQKIPVQLFPSPFLVHFIILLPSENLLSTTGAIIVEEALIIKQFVNQVRHTVAIISRIISMLGSYLPITFNFRLMLKLQGGHNEIIMETSMRIFCFKR